MAPFPVIKTTFEPTKSIQPIYTGGSIAVDRSGRILASCVGEDVLLTDLNTGERLARIEGVCRIHYFSIMHMGVSLNIICIANSFFNHPRTVKLSPRSLVSA